MKLDNAIARLGICRCGKSLKVIDNRKTCGCKNWNERGIAGQKDALQAGGDVAKSVPGETGRKLPSQKAVNQHLSKLTVQLIVQFLQKMDFVVLLATVMSITCIKTSSSQNICCCQWKDST